MWIGKADREFDLARNLVGVSQRLAIRLYPETLLVPYDEQEGAWRVKYPDLAKPQIRVKGYDLSKNLYGLAQRASDLLIEFAALEGEQYDDGYIPPIHLWTFSPPGGLQGFAFDLSVPAEVPDSKKAVKYFRETGALRLDIAGWHDFQEYDPGKAENVILGLIGKDRIGSLDFAYWFLDGLTRAKEVYPTELPKFI